MSYKTLSSHNLISKVYRDFNIKYADWEVNAIEWISDALRTIRAFAGLIPKKEKKTVANYTTQLPCDLETLVAVVHQGYRLPANTAANDTCIAEAGCALVRHPSHSYTLLHNNTIATTFETGTVVFLYVAIPTDCDGYPLIPDNQKLLDALAWYIVRMCLLRGYIHPVITFKDAEVMWDRLYPRAKNSMIMMDRDRRDAIHEIWTSMVKEPHPAQNYFLDESCGTADNEAGSNVTSSTGSGVSGESKTITFTFNITGVLFTLSPDLPVIVTGNTFAIQRTDGNYNWQAMATGYQTQTGLISVLGNNESKVINMQI